MEERVDSWNDGRLDELSQRVDNGFSKVDDRFKQVDDRFKQVDDRFKQVDDRFERVEQEMKEGFAQTASREDIREVKVELHRINERLDRLHYVLIAAAVGVIGSLLAGVAWS